MNTITPEENMRRHQLLCSDPQRYLEMMNTIIAENPSDSHEYFARSHAWFMLGKQEAAIGDMDRSLALEDHYIVRLSRGNLLMELGRYREALKDYNRSEAMAPERWQDAWGPVYRADCHARLGDDTAALADCALLPEDGFIYPGLHGSPIGTKTEVIAEIRRRAAAARQGGA